MNFAAPLFINQFPLKLLLLLLLLPKPFSATGPTQEGQPFSQLQPCTLSMAAYSN
jgi:hypothetical protein